MEYRAIYSGEYISHGKFKYIDKWKSASGKWVYKYQENLAQKKKNFLKTHRNFVPKMKPSTKKPKANSSKWKDNPNGDRFRFRKVRDSSGKKITRTEYQNPELQRRAEYAVSKYNRDRKNKASDLGRKIMDLNDKYGPKYVMEVKQSYAVGRGKYYVQEYTMNLFGGRPVSVDTYSYNLPVLRKRKKNGLKKRTQKKS